MKNGRTAMKNNINLDFNFNDHKDQLSDHDINMIVDVVGKGCHQKTKDKLHVQLRYHANQIPRYGILDRLIKDQYGWGYVAGQSYPDEIKTVRNIILDLK